MYFKVPFAQDVRYFTKMLLVLDAPPADIITKDKKTMLIDNYTMWRIQRSAVVPADPADRTRR